VGEQADHGLPRPLVRHAKVQVRRVPEIQRVLLPEGTVEPKAAQDIRLARRRQGHLVLIFLFHETFHREPASTGRQVVAQVRALIGPDVIGVEVKKALSTTAAVSLHPEKARAAIRAGAAEAVGRAPQLRPFLPAAPIRLEVEINKADLADLAALCHGVQRVGPHTVAYQGPDMFDVWRTWLVMRNVMNSRMP